MQQNTKNKPEHRIGQIFEELVGHTVDLKLSFCDSYLMDKHKLHRYCSGSKKHLSHSDALDFLTFFNSKKHPDRNVYTLEELYMSPESQNVIEILKLKKSVK
jgi:hypothetical protein